ncbi:MBL fold metallo-hydrolase [Blastopirellula retiformator]|uniref:Putative metallo-hydrolase n=1 Tax=Blastopirellula retiformator TaxID=2527970 RepID=A0A5C5VAQ7_9BACT|nr:MBL fold metallo-hydrolase [Blastopirellula retiformator]TWT34939.1 putative metallo-hydrolase [Blastopirellula retiformator]
MLEIDAIISMPFDENTYIVRKVDSSDCLVVDPGLEPHKILDFLKQNQLTPVAILNTHGHSDHIGGNADLKKTYPDAPLIIGRGDAEKLNDPQKNLSAGFGLALISPPADQVVDEGDVLDLAGIQLEVREAPGHSVGHVVFVIHDAQAILGGDVLFAGSIGRTDFFDGDFGDLRDAIHNKLFTLPGDFVVYPGHGPATTIAEEIEENPFVGKPAGYKG